MTEKPEELENLVTPERLAKGDLWVKKNLKDRIVLANVLDRSVVEKLVKTEVLQHHHKVYGAGYLDLQRAFRSPWHPRSCAVLLAQWGIGTSLGEATEVYQNVCRGMLGRGIEIVEFAMESSDTVVNLRKYSNGLYQEHFDRLVELMDKERERVFKEKSK
jgi:hypothetical protein